MPLLPFSCWFRNCFAVVSGDEVWSYPLFWKNLPASPLFLPPALWLRCWLPFQICVIPSQSDRDRFPIAPWIICHWFTVSSAREKRKLCSDFDGSCSVAKLALQYIYFSYQSFASGFGHLFLCLHTYEESVLGIKCSLAQLSCCVWVSSGLKLGQNQFQGSWKKVKTLRLAFACWCLWPETCAAVLDFVAWSVRSCSVLV